MQVNLIHSTSIEYGKKHLTYSFDIDGISRACLQELARHRHQSLSVQSTRYTLSKNLKHEKSFINISSKKIPNEAWERSKKYLVHTGNDEVDTFSIKALENVRKGVEANIANDKLKYCIPEAMRVSLLSTWNARSLQNFLELRTNKAALWEIRELANKIYNSLPSEHAYLFKDYIKE